MLHLRGGSRSARYYARRSPHTKWLLLRQNHSTRHHQYDGGINDPMAAHALLVVSGSDPPNQLITSYASYGKLDSAREVFDRMAHRTAASYNSMASAYGRSRCVEGALEVLISMLTAGVRPTQFTFGGVFASAGAELRHGMELHALVLKTGLLQAGDFSATSLIALYGRHGRLEDAVKLFEEMPAPGVVVWNTVVSVFAKRGLVEDSMYLFRELLRRDFKLTECSFFSIVEVFQSPEDLHYGEVVHNLAMKMGMESFRAVANALINVYSSTLDPQMAERLFTFMPNIDVVSWNTIIAAYSKSETPEKALVSFFSMAFDGEFSPTEATFASCISACSFIKEPLFGQLFHAKTIKCNHEMREYVSSSLIDFYAKQQLLKDGEKVFYMMPKKTLASWNSLISAHSSSGSIGGIAILRKMLRLEFQPNAFSFSSGLVQASFLEIQQLHSLIIRLGYEFNQYVSSAIIASYSSQGNPLETIELSKSAVTSLLVVHTNIVAGVYNRCGKYQEAQKLISHLHDPDNISWNILIASCSHSGDYHQALLLFKHMLTSNFLLDKYTAVSVLSACTKLNRLDLGCSLHGLFIKLNFRLLDVFACNVLLDMYAKCGSLENSLRVFEGMDDRNLISWTATITALALHGHAQRAVEKFRQMELDGLKPDKVAFIAVLSACRHSGMVEEGLSFFQHMKKSYGIEPEMDHYICAVDLLCRIGHLMEAETMISTMPFQPNALMWRTFLNGCKRIVPTEPPICQQLRGKGLIQQRRHIKLKKQI